jgi:hypothetical protein
MESRRRLSASFSRSVRVQRSRAREPDVVARGDVKLDDLEDGSVSLPVEERRPRRAIRVDAPDA